MPRSRKGKPPETPEPAGDFEFGYDPEPEEDLERPPPPPVRVTDKAAPPPESMIALGAPPKDAMEAAKWAYSLLTLQAWETLKDNGLSEKERRKEIRTILGAAAKHMTDAARFDVKQLILKQRAELEDRKRHRAAAKLEKRPPPGNAKVIPIRRDG